MSGKLDIRKYEPIPLPTVMVVELDLSNFDLAATWINENQEDHLRDAYSDEHGLCFFDKKNQRVDAYFGDWIFMTHNKGINQFQMVNCGDPLIDQYRLVQS